jgi:dTDP-4-dehydrorhamnose reductase
VLSKRNSEEHVLESPVDAVVLRPSIVLSQGVDSARYARSILWVLPVMRRLGVLPLTGEEWIDAASVQFVAECVARMFDRSLVHRVYHLSSGPEFSITLKE